MRKLSSLGSRSLAHRKGRSILTGAGIVLGVAILFGVLVSNATTQKGVDNLIESITGRSDVVAGPVGAFDAKMPMGTIDKLRAIPDVTDVIGTYGFGTALADHHKKDDPTEPEEIGIGGIVPNEAQKVRDYNFTAGRFPAPGKDEIVLAKKTSDELGVGMGDTLKIRGKKLERTLTIVGLLDITEVGGFDGGGGRGYTSLQEAWTLQGDPTGTYDGAAIILRDNVDVDAWIQAHQDDVPGIRFQNSQTLAEGFKQFLTIFGGFLAFFAAIVLFLSAFLIYLTLSMALIERTRMYGTLRALGATSKQVRRVVIREALALGAVSTFAGLFLGLLLALGLLTQISHLFGIKIPGLQVTPGSVITAVIIGIVVTLLSALIPARRAGRLEPIVAMKGDYARDAKLSRGWIVGAAVLILSVLLNLGAGAAAAPLAVLGILLGAVLLVPVLLRPVAGLLGRLTNRMARGVGDIAVLHLTKERSRSAYTLALVMVVMSMLIATGGLFLSLRAGIDEIIDRQFGADLFVQPRTPDDGTLEAKFEKAPGIASVTAIRFGIATGYDKNHKRTELFIRTIDPDSYFATSSYFWKDGNDGDAKAALLKGDSVLLSDTVAKQLDVHTGDSIPIETTHGTKQFRIAATYIAGPGPPESTMGIKDARRYLTVGNPMGYAMKIADGYSADKVAHDLKTALPTYQLDTTTTAEQRDEARGQVVSYFNIIYAILFIAAIVGLLGLANTLAMSILHRYREIGILRAIGVTRSQAARMVLVESATLGLTALVLSFPLGFLLTYLVVRGTSAGFGFTIPTLLPWLWIPFIAIFALVIAIIASIAPGRRASKLHVVTALQYE